MSSMAGLVGVAMLGLRRRDGGAGMLLGEGEREGERTSSGRRFGEGERERG